MGSWALQRSLSLVMEILENLKKWKEITKHTIGYFNVFM